MSLWSRFKGVFASDSVKTESRKPKLTKTGETAPRHGEQAVNIQATNTKLGLFGSDDDMHATYNKNPDELVDKKGLGIYKAMLRDDQIKANSMLKKTARLSTDNTIEDASTDDEDIKIGDFCRHVLYDRMDITMRNLLLSLLSAMDFGFALAEKNFEYISDGKWEGYVGYSNINPKDPEGFYFDRFDNGSLKPRGIIQNTTSTPWRYLSKAKRDKMPRFRKDKFVHFTHMSEFNNPYGQSDLKAGYRGWLSKDAMMKYWLMYLERHGAPLPIGELPDGATTDEAKAFKSTLSNLHGKSVITVPFDFKVSYLESVRTAAPGFESAIAICNGALDRSAMVPQLMGLSGGAGTGGSYGLGKTQYDVFIFYQEFIGLQLEDAFMRQVIIPLVDLNFRDVENYPKFQFASIRRETRKDRAQIVQMLTQSGHIDKHANWVWPFMNIPINKAAIPKEGTPIYAQAAEPQATDELDLDRGTRTGDPTERSAAEGTDNHADKTETDSTNGK